MDQRRFCTSAKVVVVAGKGGVGKTTVTAAFAVLAARLGLRVLIVEVEGKSGLAAAFGVPDLTYEEIDLAPGVRGRTLTPDEALVDWLEGNGFGRVARRLGASGVLDVVASAVPGVQDILVLCADGLPGLPQAVVEPNFPKAIFQTCIVNLIRSSTGYVSYKDLKAVCADLREVYTAANVDDAMRALDKAEEKWGKQYLHVTGAWRSRKDEWTPFLAFPAELRKAIYTTNAIEALNRMLRKTLKTRGPLPTDEAAMKLLYLATRNARKTWGRAHRDWLTARMQIAIHFPGRLG